MQHGKNGVEQCNKTIILTNTFVPLHALLFWLRIKVVYLRLILNTESWNKFLLGHVAIVPEVLQKVVRSSGVSILNTIWQTLCSYAKMHKIFIAQKSYCACRVMSLVTIRSKYNFNFIMNRTRSGRELFDHPSYINYNIIVLCLTHASISFSHLPCLCFHDMWVYVVKYFFSYSWTYHRQPSIDGLMALW